jgi:uncharacterized membrane protein
MATLRVMHLGALFISGRDWLLPAAGLLGAALLVLLWAYWQAPANRAVRAICAWLKLLGVLALAACLLEPLWSGERARPGANVFVLLADNSQGMQIKDRGESQTRAALLRTLLTTDKSPWQPKLEENFQVRRYLFDSRLQATKDFGELLFDGRTTALAAALRTIGERYKGQPLAGVLLFSDGNATDVAGASLELANLPPVYPVVSGKDEPIRDIAVSNVRVSQTAFEDAPVSIQADVTAVGYSGENIVAQLVEVGQASHLSRKAENAPPPAAATPRTNSALAANPPAGAAPGEKIVAQQTQRAPRDGELLAFRFQVKPEHRGVLFYRLQAAAQRELDQFERPEQSVEATLINNSRIMAVDRGRGPYRVLYVAGRPNWEYKFLHRAIEDDEQIQLVGLIRIAKREPKFDFRGRAGESSNPLYRGFGNQSKEEIERYDQPVLVRLNTRDEFELRGGFPKNAEDLYPYHAVVLDDLEVEFFTADQMMLLQKFVSERGGGFLMLGGQESLAQGKYQRTAVGDMLPVYLDHLSDAPSADWRLTLTREGWLQPWARLRSNEVDEKNRLTDMPPFQVLNRVRGVKPGASVIASVTDSRGNAFPALVAQRFGNGRSAALAVGDFWHWGLRSENHQRDLAKAWRQLLRWLVADVPERVNLQVEQQPGDPNQAVLLQVRARDQKFQPLDNADVTLTVQPVGPAALRSQQSARNLLPQAPAPITPDIARTGEVAGPRSIRLRAEPALSEPGLYQATYIPREATGYYVEATITNAVGAQVGRAEAGWTSDLAADEFRSLKPNRSLLEMIAQKTAGEIVAADKLDEFVRGLPNRKVPITESWSFPVWHRASVFLFALICFVLEWGIRRWKGLA